MSYATLVRRAVSCCLWFAAASAGAAVPTPSNAIYLDVIGRYAAGSFDQGAAEIPAYDPISKRLFVVNGATPSIDVLDLSNPNSPVKVAEIDVTLYGQAANSVAVRKPTSLFYGGRDRRAIGGSLRNVVAVAIEASPKQNPGVVAFFDTTSLQLISKAQVGALPDMLTFSPDGRYVLVANEGEPNDSYTVDPEGSVSVINVSDLAHPTVKQVLFTSFNAQAAALKAQGIRIFGPNASVAQDFEPEYIAVSDNSRTAYVTLQENNALAVVDIVTAAVTNLFPLGYKDHNLADNGLDATDRDGPGNTALINIAQKAVRGLYMPDAVALYTVGGQSYLVMANEGDARVYPQSGEDEGEVFSEEARISSRDLDNTLFPNEATLKGNGVNGAGRLNITRTLGDTDGDGDFDALYSFGARSFSIRRTNANLVWDSGDQIEQITAAALPANFNASNTNHNLDDRSDNKGPEPEGVTLGTIGGRIYAFVGLERVGGILVYDVTVPSAPQFATYVNPRNFAVAPANAGDLNLPQPGDLGPEGLTFIAAADSPTGVPLLVVANEVSGTTTVFQIALDK
jgi:DNA-binding beta-propeller fold protein YncE